MADHHPVAPRPFELLPLSADGMEAAVNLHRATLGYSLNSRLGAGHLAHLYSTLRQDPTCMVTVAVSGEIILGMVSAVLDPRQFKRRIFVSMPFRRWVALAGRFVSGPGLWLEFLQSQPLERPVVFKGDVVRPYLAAIAVASSARRAGVGRALVAAVDGFVRQNGHARYHLDTRTDNAVACTFYSRLGFIKFEERGRDVIFVREL